ncbi:hypothetical protein AL073_10040 [Loktanella sp. 1ANDIMAR09]|nr:hypothetical protein AL073_10040 [Loktanella sp. 1ANDIMAR09]
MKAMKAIVLSCDKYHPMADNMIQSYNDLWPNHPFTFRVPYQVHPSLLVQRHGELLEPINTPPDIKGTLLALLEDLPDNEWVYWCIDDKFPIALDISVVSEIFEYVRKMNNENVQGVLFCRCRGLLKDQNLRMDTIVDGPAGTKFIERKNYWQFWIHQFMRVSVLRNLFLSFPDENFKAKEMDTFIKGTFTGIKKYKRKQKMYLTLQNYAQFGESTHRGMLTSLCNQSMWDKGIENSTNMDVCEFSPIMGDMDT